MLFRSVLLVLTGGLDWFSPRALPLTLDPLPVTPQDDPWYEDLGAEVAPLTAFDAVLMRKDPPFDIEFLNATLLLSRAEAEGARVINDPRALRDHNEKLAIMEFPQFVVPTLVTRDIALIKEFHLEHLDIVVKPLDGMGDNLTEVNVTSPTCFVEITEQSGFTVAAMFIDALEKEVAAPGRARA